MTSHPLAVAVLGSGPLAERLAARIDAAADFRCVQIGPPGPTPPPGADCAVYVPTAEDLRGELPGTLLPLLLRGGVDVVTTLPPGDGPPAAEIHEACRAGGTVFHASGGFQSAVAARVTRSLAAASRGIRRIELVEQIALPDAGVHPWTALSDTGIGSADPDAAAVAAALVNGYYEAGLRVLDAAAFGGVAADNHPLSVSVRTEADADGRVERVEVDRDLGPQLRYRSVWTRHTGDPEPLRYRLRTTTAEAASEATVRFAFDGDLHPADHLTCLDVLTALRALPGVTGPGVLRRDLAITHLKPDEWLRHVPPPGSADAESVAARPVD
ncbi:hypothetical protein ACFYTF_26655 [Nocardia thailandica]|uniref:Oxidoreductase n=1 Tax=Nocardia thailandica TaxID=257275 RepID=A0ABW6PW73_9NOCA